MKIFPAGLLSGALLLAGAAAGVSEHSPKSATAAANINTAGVRSVVVLGTADAELAEPTQQRRAQCHSGGSCDDYTIWMALHAAP